MKWLRNRLSKIKTGFALVLLATVVGCATSSTFVVPTVPDPVVQWAEENVYKVLPDMGGSGSGFWVDEETFMTACHVVSYMYYQWEQGKEGSPWRKKEVFVIDEMATVKSHDELENYAMMVISCDRETDLAILKPIAKKNLGAGGVVNGVPERGTAVWGPGYPLGMGLTITTGHWQSHDQKYDYLITTPTIFGDSGSPAVILEDGVVKIVGMRVAIKGDPAYGPFPHLAIVVSGPTMQDHLDQYNVNVE